MSNIIATEYRKFEDIKHIADNGYEFWEARELSKVLQYFEWRNFCKVIDRAMLACKNSGFSIVEQFVETNKQFVGGNGAVQHGKDYHLSRYACYLIVQNGDPRKQVIAEGQTYFAIQTRRQEVADYFNQLDEDNKRLVIRGDIKQWNQMLADTAKKVGKITDDEFAAFQNAGYMGLYGGETVADIHARKGLKFKQKILDYMNSQELIANLFRISLADEKLNKEKITQPAKAIALHNQVGQEVRETIKRVGGTLPEAQPTPTKGIDEITKEQLARLKAQKYLMLDE